MKQPSETEDTAADMIRRITEMLAKLKPSMATNRVLGGLAAVYVIVDNLLKSQEIKQQQTN